ncbi:2-amino-4-hydroxy-6-hydroxymethyldihydropteridine diphosphokinase [Flavobacteriaceae bacterium]|jgi:deoxyguanosine kinase|nr:2-amino-4-hydroxy-6-hydroxymethyldihydropteridine diphosphokinase [Flavobacteriaceae bacterium]MDB9988648.1 2-amino-4-hydroxy-6-hydroxymethyldihydropteridine diphosphokinase [Flavobacteriaceae bacterium]|tara:strand:+ start:1196 stop:1690 length:495 start_codon:yes stop_codon:yes gene_type:complete
MVYIGLGSNIGNRFALLQEAVDCIDSSIGTILSVSKVYETPAWGFESEAFLNACIKIETKYTAFEVLEALLSIENKLGRDRNPREGYQARPIDLDILLFKNDVISQKHLQLPHPRMELRQFVLTPLADIAASIVHPQLQKSIEELQQICEDDSVLSIWNEQLKF